MRSRRRRCAPRSRWPPTSCASATSSTMPASPAPIAVFRAPDLGTTGTLPVAAVLAALRAHQVIGVDTRGLEGNRGDAAGAHHRSQGARAKRRPRAGAPPRSWRSRQSQHHLRPRRRRSQARAAISGALQPTSARYDAAQHPLRRRPSRSPARTARRRPSCASPAPRSRPSRRRCWRAVSSAARC